MYLARLLPGVLLLCSLPAFTQDQPPRRSRPTRKVQLMPNREAAHATPLEPWRIIPNHELNAEWLQDPTDYRKMHPDRYQTAFDQQVIQYSASDSQSQVFIAPNGQLVTERLCYNIRSYVVARDEKDSDSTHTVKSSTCQLARQYHLKDAHDGRIQAAH